MYLEDLAFFGGLALLIEFIVMGYIIFEINILKTMFLDYIFYTYQGGGSNADYATDD